MLKDTFMFDLKSTEKEGSRKFLEKRVKSQ